MLARGVAGLGLAVVVALVAGGCSSIAKTTSDGATDAVDAVARPDAISLPDRGGGSDGASQCCSVTVRGPGTESCPCNVESATAASRTCEAVGRECLYQGCSALVSCTCRASEDGGAPSWDCQFLLLR